ncbi:MAG: hypothetical protein HQ541_16765, partial [Mariniphaga sp.]|nr:hypothetical protein [Mariniphaga sp.]
MEGIFKRYLFLILAAVIFFIAVVFEHSYLNKNPEKRLLNNFQKELNKKEESLALYLNEIKQIVIDESFNGDYLGGLYTHSQILENEELGFLILEREEIIYWSSRIISFNDIEKSPDLSKKMIELPNGYYLLQQINVGEIRIVGLILIKKNYPHENEYLKNTYNRSFHLPEDYLIRENQTENNYPIYSFEGEILFAVQPAGTVLCTKTQLFYPGIFYLISLILILLFVRCEFKKSKRQVGFKLFVLGGGIFVFYWLHVLFQFPKVFYIIGFFSPEHFAYSIWLPSLGDYFLTSIFFCFWALNFSYDADFKQLIKNSALPRKFISLLSFLALGGLYLLVNSFIKILIENSSFSFSLNRIVEFSVQSITAYFSVALLLLGLALVTIKIIEDLREELSAKTNILYTFLISLLLAALQLIAVSTVSIPILILFFVFILTLIVFTNENLRHFTLSYLIILISLFSVYSLFIIYNTVSEKERGF